MIVAKLIFKRALKRKGKRMNGLSKNLLRVSKKSENLLSGKIRQIKYNAVFDIPDKIISLKERGGRI